ncbi:MAG: type II toxin-antitoxin system RelE/ParE family toxin [Cellvibrionales bacterium]|nr:type II toxin-antitoxin system RelE/ParE family toxin [Cellvibrionales bacterium]
MKYEIKKSESFIKWLSKLKDTKAKIAIARRIARAEAGNLGDHKPVRTHLGEMRIDVGKGYRVYFAKRDKKIILLVNGGVKKTQDADIEKALKILEGY